MGHGATASRRALIDKVKECIAQTNAMTAGLTEVRDANNITAADLAALRLRVDTQKAWITSLENAAGRESTRLTKTRVESGRIDCKVENFIDHMTFWQRLRWLLTGRTQMLTTERTYTEGALATAATDLRERLQARIAEHADPAANDFSRQPYGGESAGMAPRPLP